MRKQILTLIITYLSRYGRTKVLTAYFACVSACVGGVMISSITITDSGIQIELGTVDWIALAIIIIITIPVLIYLHDKESPKEKSPFETVYIPILNKIFDCLDIEHYSRWSYGIVNAGDFLLSRIQYERLVELRRVIKNRDNTLSITEWDNQIDNLGLLVTDLLHEIDRYLIPCGESHYTVEKFYKSRSNYNPNYELDLQKYLQHIILISDLGLELTRLLNMILCNIRKQKPDYKVAVGNLFIENTFDDNVILYRQREISDTPYPGIEKFMTIRASREHSMDCSKE